MSAGLGKNENTVTIGISGGLGNQMFQYAAARALSLKTGARLLLDLSFFREGRHRAYQLDAFPIIAEVAGKDDSRSIVGRLLSPLIGGGRIPTYREPHYHFDPAFKALRPPVRLSGYFQSPRYFADQADAIRSELSPPAAADPESLGLAMRMVSEKAAALHVRRGDYVSSQKNQAIYATCSLSYYEHAMECLPADIPVFVFSDDIGWARDNLPRVRDLVFVGGDGERSNLADLWLMTRAHHHITANSSFSWWGAWLAGPEKGLTIAPSKWFNDEAIRDDDLFPADWKRLPV